MSACKASESLDEPWADLGPVGANLFAKAIKTHKDASDVLASSRMNSLPQGLVVCL